MSKIRITNCHIHTFTEKHVPVYYPHPAVVYLKKAPWVLKTLAGLLRFLTFTRKADTLNRLYQFQTEASKNKQSEILDAVRTYYPSNTRFVVLPMDMSEIGHGPVPISLKDQHDELAKMAGEPEYKALVIPFATIAPKREETEVVSTVPGTPNFSNASERVLETRRAIEVLGFRGLKLYPRLGFPPDHKELMQQIYPMLQEHNLPVMSHCMNGGVQGRWLKSHLAIDYTMPAAFIPVMEAFPDLRICLAHFGGPSHWPKYSKNGAIIKSQVAPKDNWQVKIREMIASGDWPGLWADISYTMFHVEDKTPVLRHFLQGDGQEAKALRRRVLFGSDFYMTRRKALSEKEVCLRLRNELGEDVFRCIAEVNPEVWLGETLEKEI